MGFLSFVFAASSVTAETRSDDDFVDRLSHRITMVVLLVFSAIVCNLQFIYGNPITCWVPAHFSDNHEEYTKNYCWVRNTYYLPYDDYIPRPDGQRKYLPYYQWVPVILMVQALVFHLPCTLWRSLSGRCGLNMGDFVEKSQALPILDEEELHVLRNKTLGHLAGLVSRMVKSQNCERKMKATLTMKHLLTRTCFRPCGRTHGNYLMTLYLWCKFLYLLNALGQLFALNLFLGMDYHIYGLDIYNALAQDGDWTASPAFPRVTMCDFNVRRLGNVQRYTVQCTLPINLFNEKFFLFLYFWLVMVSIMSFFSFINWATKVLPVSSRYQYVKKRLFPLLNEIKDPVLRDREKNKMRHFVDKYLKVDGVFALMLTGRNTDAVSEADLVNAIYKRYKEDQGEDQGDEEPTGEGPGLYPSLSRMHEGDDADSTEKETGL